ncbi:hypothetical protein EG327_007643 [Venturia inaequalis]|uniref:Endothelin-converting enzyme 1 n=1 Tax=Venturia inaequalis TaxID=5025 RepID=A0A8H3UYR9_VENIN|nr:hypothetical protein EG327_007643 [Venturia inaequalis]
MPSTPTPNEQTPLFSNGASNGAEPVPSEGSRWAKVRSWLWQNAVVIALSTLLFIALVFVLIFGLTRHQKESSPAPHPAPPKTPGDSGPPICTGAGCVLAAATLLKSISPRYKDLNPCDDFRTYTCEGFDALHEIREDQTSVGSLFLMSEDNQLILKRILESPAPSKTSLFWTASNPDQVIHDKLSNAYQACVNETELKSIGSKPLLDLLLEIEKTYPTKKPKKSDTSLTDVSYLLSTIGVDGLVGFGVSADDKNPDANVLLFGGPGSFGLPSKEYYNNTDIVSSYKETIGAVLEALLKEAYPNVTTTLSVFRTANKPTILNQTLVDSLVKFEAELAAASPDPEDASDVTQYYNPRTVKEAQKYIPDVSISTIIDKFTGGYEPSKIIVMSPDYLKSLSAILKTQSREVLQAFFVWKTVQAWGGSVEDDAVQPLQRFRNKLQGKAADVKGERWRTCVSTVGSDLSWILSRFFIERAFSKESKDLGDKIIQDIKHEFSIKLDNSEWMSPSVRDLAKDKVRIIRQKIGYPTISPDITNATALENYYSKVKVSAGTFFENRLSTTKDEVAREWEQVGKPVDKETWGMSAFTVNAYYNPPGNEIVFPAGIMQAPVFYDPSVPSYLSYGAFGAVAGHELSHAFDSTGRNYDQNGNFTDWWDKSTIDAFKKKTDCFVEQYHNYTIPTKDGPLPINGKLTLGENIADAGGLTAAFKAWKSNEEKKKDDMLPGLEYFTKDQIFFLAYGLTWCGKAREEQRVQRIYTDPHSPDIFRILGTTANSREFREAFDCPVKEPTCELW